MKTARFAKLARRFALGMAVGACALSLAISTPSTVSADAVDDTRTALAQFKRGNFEDAIKAFEDIMNSGLDEESKAKVRDEVSLDIATDFVANQLADDTLRRRLRGIGLWLLSSSTTGEDSDGTIGGRLVDDPEGVKRFVDEYMVESNISIRTQRAHQIRDKYGEFAIPYIQRTYFRDANVDLRARAAGLAAVIGGQATMALVQVMQSSNDLDREYAAIALGLIKDGRALPALKQAYSDGNQPQGVRNASLRAMEAILKSAGPAVAEAHTLWLLQAEGYYRNASSGGYGSHQLIGRGFGGDLPTVIDVPDRQYAVWRWSDAENEGNGGLFYEMVPAWALADTIAEECAIQAIDLASASAIDRGYESPDEDPFVLDANALLARISIHQYVSGRTRMGNGSEDERAFIMRTLGENGVARFQHLMGYAAALGNDAVLRAIELSYSDGYPMVTVGLIDTLLKIDEMPQAVDAGLDWEARGEDEEVETPEVEFVGNPLAPIYRPLTMGLSNPDRRIRYAAARALVGAGRMADFGANATAQNSFANSLAETSSRSVMLIAENAQLRSKFVVALENLGYSVVQFSDLQEGILQATQSPVIDAIILEAEIAGTPVFKWAPSATELENSDANEADLPMSILTSDVRTQTIPLFLAGHEGQKDEFEGRFDSYSNDTTFTSDSYITYGDNVNFNAQELDDTLNLAFTRNSELEMFSHNVFVRDSARVLKKLDPNNTSFEVSGLLKALGSSLQAEDGRTSDARIAIANAVGHLSAYNDLDFAVGQDIISQLSGVLESESDVDTPAVKAAAAKALGEIFRNHKTLYRNGGSAFSALMNLMRLQYDFSAVSDDNEGFRTRVKADVINARNEAGIALGRAPLSPGERSAVRSNQRASRHIPIADQGKEGGGDED